MFYLRLSLAILVSLICAQASAQTKLNVVTSIKPIHSLVAGVMEGVGEPFLIIQGSGSPHGYSMRPSAAVAIQQADLVFWVGHDLETFLEKPLESLSGGTKAIELMDSEGLSLLKFREGRDFAKHDHDDHSGHDDHGKHDDHDDHADDKHDHDKHADHAEKKHDHDHDKHDDHAEDKHEHDHGHDHAKGAIDPHIWLDPINAKAIVSAVATALSKADPANAASYERNATALRDELDLLHEEVKTKLAPLQKRKFIVFHDGYHYFESRFGVEAAASVAVSPEAGIGAKRIREIQSVIKEQDAVCVFAEPQFSEKFLQSVAEGTSVKTGMLDPLGFDQDKGKELYFRVLRGIARSFSDCLS